MARSKFYVRPRIRAKDKEKVDDYEPFSLTKTVYTWGDRFEKGMTSAVISMLWMLPFVMITCLTVSAMQRNRCAVCHLSSGRCEKLTTGLMDSVSFRKKEYKPFSGIGAGNVFETSNISCASTGVNCQWQTGEFGMLPPLRS